MSIGVINEASPRLVVVTSARLTDVEAIALGTIRRLLEALREMRVSRG